MADEVITSTQPDSIGNLLGDIGSLDHHSNSFQAAPLQPQPSAPQPMSSAPNASKSLVDDFDPHITTTSASSNPANPTNNSAAPNSSSSFTPGELTSNNPTLISDDDDDDYKENHQHHHEEGNTYHPDDDDDDDGYDDHEEELEEINYQKNGAPYQDNPAFSDSDSTSEFHHHTEAVREPSPYSAPPVQSSANDKIGGYDSDEHMYDEDVEEEIKEDARLSEEEYEHPHLVDHHQANEANEEEEDDDDIESLTEDNVVVLDDEEGDHDDDQFVYSASAAAAATTSAIPATETPEILETPSKSFETESSTQPSSLLSSEIPSPFSSSAVQIGADVEAEAEEASSAFDLAEDPSPALSTTTTNTNYAPPSPSAPPAAATFSSSPSDDATSAVIPQLMGDDDAASGFAGAVTGGRVSPAAAATEMMKTMDNYDNDDHLQMSSAPTLSPTSLSSSPPLAPQPSAPPQPVEADPFHPPIVTSSTPQQASSTLYNSHSTRENRISSEPESFTAEPNVVQTSPKFTDRPNEVQHEPTLEGPWLKNIDPKEDAEPEVTLRDIPGLSTILDLIYWRDVKKTGVVFGSMLFILLSLAIFSVLSVIAYLSLAILSVTLSFRVYKNIMQAVQKSGEGHPFKEYLEWDIELNDAKTQKVVKLVMKHFNATVRELRRLFLVEDLVDSIKFGLLLWVLTYIGSWFNGMTLIINSVVIVFTLPKIYETYKVQIDNYLAMARSQFNKILQQVQSKLPFLKKKAKAQ